MRGKGESTWRDEEKERRNLQGIGEVRKCETSGRGEMGRSSRGARRRREGRAVDDLLCGVDDDNDVDVVQRQL